MAKKKKKSKKGKKKSGSLGKWGSLTFVASRNKTRTFSDMTWKTKINFTEKERKKKVSKVTFKGIAPDEISFKMRLSVFDGMNPLKEMNKVTKVARKGKKNRLVIGGKNYGHGKMVITDITRNLNFFDNKGNLWVAEMQVTMKEKP